MLSYCVAKPGPSKFFSSLALFLLVIFVLFSAGCGGSSSTPVTVTGPAPTFTSTAPTVAREGALYTYNLTTTTTDNSTVSYTLSSGPDGATVSGSTVSWTPTHAESRTANLFTVKATTSNNGTANQSFTLTPTGSVNGTIVDHAITGSGSVDYDEDLSGSTVEVLVPNGKGGFNIYRGAGDSAGFFTIANVPTGNFWLHITQNAAGATSNNYIWTAASDIDLGTTLTGRPDATPIHSGVTVAPNVSLSVSPVSGDTVNWQSPDAGAFGSPSGGVTNPYIASFAQNGNLIDSSKGDRAFLVHYTSSSPANLVTVHSIVEDIEYDSLQQSDGSTTHLTGSMTSVGGSTIHPVLNLSQFDAMIAPLINNPFVQRYFDIVDTGYPGTYGYVDGVNLVHADMSAENLDTDLGTINYGPVTSGVAYYNFLEAGSRKYSFPGGTMTVLVGSRMISNSFPASTSPIVPAITLVQSPKIDGRDFFSSQTNTSLAPQVAWGPPGTGTATYYELIIIDITNSQAAQWNFFTNGTGAAVPPGILKTGHTYVMQIVAVNDSGATYATAPFRHGSVVSYSYTPSGVITGGVPPGSTKQNAAQAVTRKTWELAPGRDGQLHLRVSQ